ncbi:hypothetical protein K227x_04310 [Rubripirellula lacrimiformis]|uniref:Uncharacterized protein n=2 Tax=Rubripirellula lacrimiformis TaxID=1930273 RepID=A0A517N4J4_9BACT|nr:hypothetical protein K227x_04310 [Rubripirellula lacrimiformis]
MCQRGGGLCSPAGYSRQYLTPLPEYATAQVNPPIHDWTIQHHRFAIDSRPAWPIGEQSRRIPDDFDTDAMMEQSLRRDRWVAEFTIDRLWHRDKLLC